MLLCPSLQPCRLHSGPAPYGCSCGSCIVRPGVVKPSHRFSTYCYLSEAGCFKTSLHGSFSYEVVVLACWFSLMCCNMLLQQQCLLCRDVSAETSVSHHRIEIDLNAVCTIGKLTLQGKGDVQAWNSCSHGAGRAMSRTKAKATITQVSPSSH